MQQCLWYLLLRGKVRYHYNSQYLTYKVTGVVAFGFPGLQRSIQYSEAFH